MQEQIEKVVSWLQKLYRGREAVVAVSGGVDSAVVLTLLTRALGVEKVTPVLLPYKGQNMQDARHIVEWNGYQKHEEINIGEMVDGIVSKLYVSDQVRKGNIIARVRMIVVYDLAKAKGAWVCGTENKSELELGYYTRFGDAASDVEPIAHLYKTEVWEIAKELGLPKVFVTKAPSAGLWEGQTDEAELGFNYHDADLALRGKEKGLNQETVRRVKEQVRRNTFKRKVPYHSGN